ncbi:carbonic anhydrase [Gautieria morchelliformis]|nr:carbonic anhydrase [Gautieria morchelliformis]
MSHEHSQLGHPGMPFERLLPNNSIWAADVSRKDPKFFKVLAEGQSPQTLWIGCSDSRVPETVITGCRPGDIFVHRNIANLFNPSDPNGQSVLSYAVRHLGVKHVVVVGHSQCGGCKAALAASKNGPNAPADPELPSNAPLNIWMAPLVRLAWSLGQVSLDKLVVANVEAQVEELKKSSTVRENKDVRVHGWVFMLEAGRLKRTRPGRKDGEGEVCETSA